jgi:molybdate transport system regulatory protein
LEEGKLSKRFAPNFKVWLEFSGRSIAGDYRIRLLEGIKRNGSIGRAAKDASIPYRSAWQHIKNMEAGLGSPVIETFKGGRNGGGGARLTRLGEVLLKDYLKQRNLLKAVMEDKELWEACSLKISARNRLKGKVVNVEKGQITANVKIEIMAPIMITALITKEAVEDLDIKPGDVVEAVVKSTEVMVAKE